jgi:hypothetical protein
MAGLLCRVCVCVCVCVCVRLHSATPVSAAARKPGTRAKVQLEHGVGQRDKNIKETRAASTTWVGGR